MWVQKILLGQRKNMVKKKLGKKNFGIKNFWFKKHLGLKKFKVSPSSSSFLL